MTNNNGVELPWKKVTKRSRSIIRRSKKPRVLTRTVAGESKPEKLGVSVQGQLEHVVPIKKRKFVVRSLPPSNRSSAQREGSKRRAHVKHDFYVSRLNPKLVDDGRTSNILEEKPDCGGPDFSNLDLLATVACSIAVSNDIAPAVESLPAKESVVQQQDASNLSTHVEGNDSSAGTVDASQKYVVVDSSDQVRQGKNGVLAPQKSPVVSLSNDLVDELSEEHGRVTSGGTIAAAKKISTDETSTERPKANMEAGESENLAMESGGVVTVSDKSLADDASEKNNECFKEVRLHWDLNVSMDAWAQTCDAGGVAFGRDVEGEITKSIGLKESEPIDESKDHMVGVIASDGHANSQSPSGPKSEAVARNGQEIQSGDDYQYEDGELREPYRWEGDTKEIEQVDHGSEPKYDNKKEDYEKGILAKTNSGPAKYDSPRMGEANEGNDLEKHVVVCMNDSHLKKGSSSPSRSFASKPFKELPSHDAIQRRRPDSYEELSTGPDKFASRDDRAGMRMRNRSRGRDYFGGWDSKRRLSPPNYKGGSYGFGGPRPKSMVDDPSMMNGFDQPGSGPGPDGHVRRQFSDGGYRGLSRRFPDGGDRDFTNQYPGRMRRERGNTPVFRRLHYPQSESRSRSRSPVSWNGRNRSPPPPDGFRGDEKMMERARLPSQKGFLADQEMGFMPPPKNRMSSPRFFEGRNNDGGENHNSFRETKLRPGPRFDAGNSMRRVNSDNNNNNNHLRPFIRQRRFESAEENIGGNRFEMVQQRTRQSETTEDVGDDNQLFRLNGEQSVAVANNNNNKESG